MNERTLHLEEEGGGNKTLKCYQIFFSSQLAHPESNTVNHFKEESFFKAENHTIYSKTPTRYYFFFQSTSALHNILKWHET